MKDELRREESCLDCHGGAGQKVQLMPCHGHHGNQEWIHDKVFHMSNNVHKEYLKSIGFVQLK